MSSSSSKYYFSPQHADVDTQGRLAKKIKTLKTNLKISEQHNDDLHRKLKILKEKHELMINRYEIELEQQRKMYEALAQKYDAKSLQLKDAKRSAKKLAKSRSQDGLESEMLLETLKGQNRNLQSQLVFTGNKVNELQAKIKKMSDEQTSTKAVATNIQLRLQEQLHLKNSENEAMRREKLELEKVMSLIRGQNSAYRKQNQQLKRELENLTSSIQRKQNEHTDAFKVIEDLKRRNGELEEKIRQLEKEIKNNNSNYQGMLQFNYELQKDFEKQLHSIAKQLSRRQMCKRNQKA